MLSTNSPALGRLLHYDADEDLKLKKSYHCTTAMDHVGVFGNTAHEHPASLCPPSGALHHGFCAFLGLSSCVLSRRRHTERWWFAGLFMTIGYFVAMKLHLGGCGTQGYNAGVWLASCGSIGFWTRIMAGSGSRFFNSLILSLLALQGWHDWGKAHMWTAYIAAYRQDQTPGGRVTTQSLWNEYLPRHTDPSFMQFQGLSGYEGAIDKPTDVDALVDVKYK